MLPVIPQDKANHAVYGSAIGCVVSAAAAPFIPLTLAAGVGLAFVVAAAILKEMLDEKRGGARDFKDAAATVVGGLFVALPVFLGAA